MPEQNVIVNAARAGVSMFGGDIYILGMNANTKEPFDAFPCFICKKMILNSGLVRIVCSAQDGGIRIFYVQKQVDEWSKEDTDITDDKVQYGVGFKKE